MCVLAASTSPWYPVLANNLYLPGQSIFGTNLFAFDQGNILVSPRWWVLLALDVPLTVVVFGAWLLWFRQRYSRDSARLKQNEDKSVAEGEMAVRRISTLSRLSNQA